MTSGDAALRWRFIYRGLKARVRDHRAELGAMVRALAADEIAVDVGANKGSFLWALSRATPRGRVVAFEAQPVLADYLARACQAAGLGNVSIEAAGVSERSGRLTLNVPGEGQGSPDASFEARRESSGPMTRIEVPAVSLDDYFQKETGRIGAIKIDVEGHEPAVLAGAAAMIRAHRPTVVLECEERHLGAGSVGDLIQHMLGFGYDGFFVARGALRPVGDFDPALHQRSGDGRFWDAPDYCNNFVFRPTSR